MEPINNGESEGMPEKDIREDLGRLLETLKESNRASVADRQALSTKIEEVGRKQDNIPGLLADLERRQRMDLDSLRRDFERLFVPRAEYDPKHTILIEQIKDLESRMSAASTQRDEVITLKTQVRQLEEEVEELHKHSEGSTARVYATIGVLVSVVSLVLNLSTHLVIK